VVQRVDSDESLDDEAARELHSRWRATLLAALESPTSTHIAWRVRWLAHDLLIVTEVAVGVLTAYTIFMQGLALAILVAVVWLVAGAVMRAAVGAPHCVAGDGRRSTTRSRTAAWRWSCSWRASSCASCW
jgi:hypothetical protein